MTAAGVPSDRARSNSASTREPQSEPTDLALWPLELPLGGETLAIHMPEYDSWESDQLEGRAVVTIEGTASPKPVYGMVWFRARTRELAATKEVRLEEVQVTKSDFPLRSETAPSSDQTVIQAVNQGLASRPWILSIDRLRADLVITRAAKGVRALPLQNLAPRIIVSDRPAALLLIEGKPVLRPSSATRILRVINTRALIFLDETSGEYWLRLWDKWFTAASPEGEWTEAKEASVSLELARKSAEDVEAADGSSKPAGDPAPSKASGSATPTATATPRVPAVEPFEAPSANPTTAPLAGASTDTASGSTTSSSGAPSAVPSAASPTAPATDEPLPRIIVSTTPAELVETAGKCEFRPIEGTRLLAVSNSSSHLFLEIPTQSYYVLLGGRWFRSVSLDGPWDFVEPKSLPADFARVPAADPHGDVLSSVPGTPQARDAVIANETPQTATIDRAQAKFAPVYDGSPRFEAIEGTELERAVNTRGAVIRLRGGACYAVENGVWFVAGTPTGPWQTATYVPSEIYAIPPSSSLHYVTYARVYDATPTTVVVGYTPGYLGWYAPPGACVVYGSGWVYPAWVGTVWFGPPVTYGYWWAWGRPDPWWHHWGWGPYWGPSWGPYWAWHGGYGPYGPHGPYGPYGPYGPHGPYWHGPARPVFAGGVAHSGNLYSTWGGKAVAHSTTVGGAAGRAATLRTQGLGTSASDRTRTPGTLGMPNSNRAGTAKPSATGSKGEASSRLLKEPHAEKVHESPRASPREFREPRGGSMRMPRGGGRR